MVLVLLLGITTLGVVLLWVCGVVGSGILYLPVKIYLVRIGTGQIKRIPSPL
jgi:hypothetical protein